MNLGIFSTVLAIVGLATEAALAAVLAYCRRHRQFPFFYTYAFYALFLDASAHPIKAFTSQTVYFNFYWASQVVYTILGVLAMNESFRKVLQPYFLGKWWFRCLVPGVAIIILALAAWKGLRHAPVQINRLTLFYFYLPFYLASDYMRAAIFGLFATLVVFWRARWQPCAFGIMKGFGLFTIVGMLADLLRSDFGTKMDWFFSYAPAVAYIVACLIWLGAFLKGEPENSSGKTGSLTNLDEVIEVLTRLKKALE